MLFEASRSEGGLFYFEPDLNLYRLATLKQTLARNKMIPLKELISLNPGEVLSADNDDSIIAFYGQSYALVRFLRENNYGKRLGNYHKLLMDGLNGRWELSDINKKIAADRNILLTVSWNRAVGTQLFEQYIGDDFEQIEKEYIIFCRKIVYPIRFN